MATERGDVPRLSVIVGAWNAADTLATAELLLRLWPRVLAEGASGFDDVARLAASRRWVAG